MPAVAYATDVAPGKSAQAMVCSTYAFPHPERVTQFISPALLRWDSARPICPNSFLLARMQGTMTRSRRCGAH